MSRYENPAAAIGACQRAGVKGTSSLFECAMGRDGARPTKPAWRDEAWRLAATKGGLRGAKRRRGQLRGAPRAYKYFAITPSGKIAAGYESKVDTAEFVDDNKHAAKLRIMSRSQLQARGVDASDWSNWTKGPGFAGARRARRGLRGGTKRSGLEVTLKDRLGGRVWLTIRDGVVVGAMGSDPHRFIGRTEAQARRIARYGGSGR